MVKGWFGCHGEDRVHLRGKKMFHGYLTGIISPLPTPHPTGMLAESITQVALFPFELDA